MTNKKKTTRVIPDSLKSSFYSSEKRFTLLGLYWKLLSSSGLPHRIFNLFVSFYLHIKGKQKAKIPWLFFT
jgi:hypothetical protein